MAESQLHKAPDTAQPGATRTVISVDAMGSDRGPAAVVAGCARSAAENPDIGFILHGPKDQLEPLVARRKKLAERCEIRDAQGVVTMDAKPSHVMRHGKDTSMWSAIDSVRDEEAGVCVSCGNTGALMAVSMLRLRKLEGINRPAIACLWPSRNQGGFNLMLDVGADIRAEADDLLQYALMGASYARNGLGLERPRIGLLNVGTEEHKGRAELKVAHELIWARWPASDSTTMSALSRAAIFLRPVSMSIVTDGFTGNVALKTGEGTATLIRDFLKEAFKATPLSRIAALLALTSLRRLTKRIDPRRVNGGVFLGLNGTVVKSHGSADATGDFRRDQAGRHPGAVRLYRTPCRAGCVGAIAGPRWRRGPGCERDRRMTIRAVVRGVGHYLPERVVPNSEFESSLDTTDEWIKSRSGIERRHFAAEGQGTSDLAARAARAALADAGMEADDIDAIILATSTADLTFPSAATMVQAGTGHDARICLRRSGGLRRVRLCADQCQCADRVGPGGTRAGDRRRDVQPDHGLDDRGTCVLFGDGAGALVLEAQKGDGTSADRGILATDLHSDGRYRDLLYVDGGVATQNTGHLRMQGKEVFRHAVEKLAATAETALEKAGLSDARCRLDRAAPGQLADHQGDRPEDGSAHGSCRRHRPGSRQHLGRVDPAGAVGRGRARTDQTGRSAGDRGDRRRPGLGVCGTEVVICG